MFDAVVDRAHDGHPFHQTFAPAQKRPPDDTFADPAHKDSEEQEYKDPDAAHVDIDIIAALGTKIAVDQLFGLVIGRHKGPDPTIDPAHNGPDQPKRQGNRGHNDQAREEVATRPRDQAAACVFGIVMQGIKFHLCRTLRFALI